MVALRLSNNCRSMFENLRISFYAEIDYVHIVACARARMTTSQKIQFWPTFVGPYLALIQAELLQSNRRPTTSACGN